MMVGLDLYLFMYWKIKNADSAAKFCVPILTLSKSKTHKQQRHFKNVSIPMTVEFPGEF